MKGLVLSGGSISDYNILKNHLTDKDFVICADGGVRHAIAFGIVPNLVVGDFDSIDSDSLEFIKAKNIQIISFPVEKDETDTEIAVNYLIDKGFNEITMIGVSGSRLDHTFGSIMLLDRLLRNGIKGLIADSNNTVYMSEDYLRLERKEGYYISIIPLGFNGIRVTLGGFYYPLENAHIEYGSTLGISNRIIDDYGEIKILEGKALVFHSKD